MIIESPEGDRIYLPNATEKVDLFKARDVWDQGLCTQMDPTVFFPDNESERISSAAQKKICKRCPVMDLCLEVFGKACLHGVVGGQAPKERLRAATTERKLNGLNDETVAMVRDIRARVGQGEGYASIARSYTDDPESRKRMAVRVRKIALGQNYAAVV